jgi:hypothetical protein
VILSLLGSGIPLHYDSDYTTICGNSLRGTEEDKLTDVVFESVKPGKILIDYLIYLIK